MLLYKYRSFERLDFVADILVNERLFCSPVAKLNDPFEGVFYFESHIPEPCGDAERLYRECNVSTLLGINADSIRVCCLSSDPWEVRLWALYANSCRGVAIEIEIPDAINELHRVSYSHKLPSFLENNPTPMAHEPLVHKTAVWEYESEYRIITSNDYWSVSGQIKRVIVGPRCSKEDRVILERMAPTGTEFVNAVANPLWQSVVSKLQPDYVKTHGLPRSVRMIP